MKIMLNIIQIVLVNEKLDVTMLRPTCCYFNYDNMIVAIAHYTRCLTLQQLVTLFTSNPH